MSFRNYLLTNNPADGFSGFWITFAAMAFLYPGFLWALTALSIPIIIHLFNFRRYRRVYFSSVRFLKEAKEETTSVSRLKHLLILIARLLTVLFLVLAFAQPFLPENHAVVQKGEQSVSIYIDNSFSMESVAKEGTLLEEAKAKAKAIVQAFGPNDRFQLLTNDFEGKQQRLVSADEFLQQLEEVKVSPVFRTLQEVQRRQLDVLHGTDPGKASLYEISDFQKGMLEGNFSPDTSVRTFLLPLKADEIANVSIDSVAFLLPIHQQNGNESLVVQFRNTGSEAVENAPVKLMVNGQQKVISSISIPAHSLQLDTLVFTNSGSGLQQGILTVTDYPVTFDDTYYFTWTVAPERAVLLVSEEEPNPFLSSVYAGDTFFKLNKTPIGSLNYSTFYKYPLIILDGLNAISSGLSQELKRFVESGGSLLVFPSEKPDLESYSQWASLLPAIPYAAEQNLTDKVVAIDLQNEIFAGVFDKAPSLANLPQTKKILPLQLSSRSAATLLLTLTADRPFLTLSPLGKGRVYQSAVPLSTAWSNFPQHALFLPLLYRIALLSNHDLPLAYTIGNSEGLQLPADLVAEEGSVVLAAKDIEIIPDVRNTTLGTELFVGDQVKRAGFYAVQSNGMQLGTMGFNFNRQESVLEYYPSEELEEKYTGAKIQLIEEAHGALQNAITRVNKGFPLWRYCMMLVLLFVLAEILLIRLGDRWLSRRAT